QLRSSTWAAAGPSLLRPEPDHSLLNFELYSLHEGYSGGDHRGPLLVRLWEVGRRRREDPGRLCGLRPGDQVRKLGGREGSDGRGTGGAVFESGSAEAPRNDLE